jgi:hypothetical protein
VHSPYKNDTWAYNDNRQVATRITVKGTLTYEYDDNRKTEMVDGTDTTPCNWDNPGILTGRSAVSGQRGGVLL